MNTEAPLSTNATDPQGVNFGTDDDTARLGELITALQQKTKALEDLAKTQSEGDVATAIQAVFLEGRSAHAEFQALQIEPSRTAGKHRETLCAGFRKAIAAIQDREPTNLYIQQLQGYDELAAL